jgi:hypothetical protein
MKKSYSSEDIVKHLPLPVKRHLTRMAEQVTKLEPEEAFARLVNAWIVKRAMFDRIVEHGNFKKSNHYKKDSRVGCIAMTISGSIVTLGPLEEAGRRVSYTSLGLRVDVPDVKIDNDGELKKDIVLDSGIEFNRGPVQTTSIIIDVAVIDTEKSVDEQKAEINVANEMLFQNFTEVNRTIMEKECGDTDLKCRDDLFEQWVILDWFSIGGLDEHIFMARARILWLELFTELYEYLSVSKSLREDRDQVFLEFSNQRFASYIDDYKWYESEKKDFDIGLMKALEEIPGYASFWDYVDNYISEIA